MTPEDLKRWSRLNGFLADAMVALSEAVSVANPAQLSELSGIAELITSAHHQLASLMVNAKLGDVTDGGTRENINRQ